MPKTLIIGIIISIILTIILIILGIYVYQKYKLTLKNPNDLLERLKLYENYADNQIPYSFRILKNNKMQIAYYEAQGFRKGINVFTADYQVLHINQILLTNFAMIYYFYN